MDEWIGEESVILCMNYELSWVEVSLSLPVQGWGTLGCTPDSQSIRLGQAEAKVGGKAKEERPCHFSPVQPSPTATARLRLLRETTTLRHQPPPPSPLPCPVVAFASLPRFSQG